ncbi:MAG: WD40/YVTN/BNR-like repeat-containing protein [Terriglobales bacterium]
MTVVLMVMASFAVAQTSSTYAGMRWREIGPTRAGRARAVAGDPVHANITYIGFDNGGVWKSTDYGSNWVPIFDHEPTGSIGAIAIAPSDPNVIYVGTGAGIIRPDLSTGGGVYKSTDAGKTWTHLGLDDTEMIANIAVDPHDPNRVFVAALGHPYGPNALRGIFRSTDGGQTWKKVLYVDEYTSANDVRINPQDPNIVYAALWQQQEGFVEDMSFSGTAGDSTGGIFKSTDGGDTWTKLTQGLPTILEANLALAPSHPNTLYATVAAVRSAGRARGGFGGPGVQFYSSQDGGASWKLASTDPRPMARIGGGDVPTLAVDPKNPGVVYDCSTVFWRTENGGHTWSAVRGSPGGDDYQKVFVSPVNDNVIDLVSDQGGVISANRGLSWSNWYTQNTAAMYHVTADNAFPYRLCSGQQDSGSACVKSRSMDGEITFHDWHPVMTQEYAEAAPDPKNPNLVYGAARTGISLYNRATGQKASVGPNIPFGSPYGRGVRTMPIIWSPVNPNLLLFATNAVWKTLNGGHSWTRISGDLTRGAGWAVPANAGKYASTVHPSALGTITALAPSPLDAQLIWAGTDDGLVQVTSDGGATWKNVTPPGIRPWARIFNLDAGHFSTGTAYLAVNTMRLDDSNPHFYRTHDGGKTWTEIDNGLAPGAEANSIRQDTKVKNLLYAATETQVWVSFNDGDRWHSLKLNMPPVSVRDIEIKNDASCLCDDLVAGTHGRGFWILDDVTTLQQEAQAAAAPTAYLFKPETGIRIRFATNDPTPWPPELPHGVNPPPGPILDYYLAHDVSGPVVIQILKGTQVIRTYSSAGNPTGPNPDQDPAAYNQLCQLNPRLAHCDMTMYWPAAPRVISTRAGEHRIWWDMHYDPIPGVNAFGGDGDNGAVPHRTEPSVASPLAAPGDYTVKLTVDGQSSTQPLVFKLDPRVKTPLAGLDQLYRLSAEMYAGAQADHAAYEDARAAFTRTSDPALQRQIEALAPPPPPPGGGRGGFARFRRGPSGPPSLSSVADAEMGAAMAMQSMDLTPSATAIANCEHARAQAQAVLAKWHALKAKLGAAAQ